jgi:hypothetical protein
VRYFWSLGFQDLKSKVSGSTVFTVKAHLRKCKKANELQKISGIENPSLRKQFNLRICLASKTKSEKGIQLEKITDIEKPSLRKLLNLRKCLTSKIQVWQRNSTSENV